MRVQYIVLFVFMLFNWGCVFSGDNNKKNEVPDNFYSDLGGLDRPRIPLIKPYELLKVSGTEWRLELNNPELLTLSIHNVKGVDIHDSLILIYSDGGTEFLNAQHPKAWFIIEPALGLEKGFDDETKFANAFHKTKSGINFHFHSPDSIYVKFEKIRKIIW